MWPALTNGWNFTQHAPSVDALFNTVRITIHSSSFQQLTDAMVGFIFLQI